MTKVHDACDALGEGVVRSEKLGGYPAISYE